MELASGVSEAGREDDEVTAIVGCPPETVRTKCAPQRNLIQLCVDIWYCFPRDPWCSGTGREGRCLQRLSRKATMSSARQVPLTSHRTHKPHVLLSVTMYVLSYTCTSCSHYTVCSIGGKDSDQKFIDVRMRAVGRKVVILSGKGGQLEGSHCTWILHCVTKHRISFSGSCACAWYSPYN